MRIRDGLCVGMAVDTAKHGVVRRIRMTVGANAPSAGMCTRVDRELIVGKRCSGPGDGRMAADTCFRKACGNVIRAGYRVVFLGVAGVAVGRRSSIDVSDVAGRTLRCCMRTCKYKLCLAVIEDCAHPLHGRMAKRAVLRESGRSVIGIRRCGVIGQVTTDTCCTEPRELAVHMTGGAGHGNVSAHQREFRRGVVESCRSPGQIRMTGGTIGRETGCYVIGIRCRIELTQVAARAGGVQCRECATDVTRCACHASMCSR